MVTGNTTSAADVDASPTATAAFVTALVFNSAIAAVFVSAFLILWRRFPLTYAPRASLVPSMKQSPPVHPGVFSWLTTSLAISDDEYITRSGADLFSVVFFFRQMSRLFILVALGGAALLFPLHATGDSSLSGINILTLGNVGQDQSPRLWSNLILSFLFVAATLKVVFTLLEKATALRSRFVLSTEQTTGIAGYTLLVRDVPEDLRDREALRTLFDRVQPGQVHDVILARDADGLGSLSDDRMNARNNLEGASASYLAATTKAGPAASEADAAALRPKHRKYIVAGENLDSLETYAKDMKEADGKLQALREKKNVVSGKSAFIVFSNIFSPHVAALANIHGQPGVFHEKIPGVYPDDIIWENLGMPL
ncbi:late exocytosis, associated with Golgi transport-domain-containing protein [Blyttiomyces helicus]|uniref:Late exocytosis, associated with Golgi transport-domain-containing protein n=1 Tax=Blyttiomyces helicus TaxID=388810 RepID=A0A4P9W0C5_9FUNG|nr:late exocytosis, associated with Golgi transport-domain-containing protein [Blyttiomyces helicus]|eukprot:RKO85082.1 late exocytosis, associated with Golgi transport-domain-containing protein [Blyttiomyces helicus]